MRYIVSESDLTSVADELRAKYDSTALLTFPDEWTAKIRSLTNTSETDVEPSDVRFGKVYFDSNGERKVGAMRPNTFYCTCSTAASTRAKVITCADSSFALFEGVIIYVKFENAQTASTSTYPVTFDVNSTGAKDVMRQGTTVLPRYAWQAGEIIAFIYDGTNWVQLHGGIATTTYYGQVKLNNTTSSTSTSLAATANAVKLAFDKMPTATIADAGKVITVDSDGNYILA